MYYLEAGKDEFIFIIMTERLESSEVIISNLLLSKFTVNQVLGKRKLTVDPFFETSRLDR